MDVLNRSCSRSRRPTRAQGCGAPDLQRPKANNGAVHEGPATSTCLEASILALTLDGRSTADVISFADGGELRPVRSHCPATSDGGVERPQAVTGERRDNRSRRPPWPSEEATRPTTLPRSRRPGSNAPTCRSPPNEFRRLNAHSKYNANRKVSPALRAWPPSDVQRAATQRRPVKDLQRCSKRNRPEAATAPDQNSGVRWRRGVAWTF
jgi:hypothetical protein